MKKNFIISKTAAEDIIDIIKYISSDNVNAALKLKGIIFSSFETISENPKIGKKRSELTTKNVRFWTVTKSYSIIYSESANKITILRVYNSARDLNKLI